MIFAAIMIIKKEKTKKRTQENITVKKRRLYFLSFGFIV
ncbi:hypothetical protein B4083_4380 [Bacillus cereus]|nr:hypothetical protein B4083_4380 [Bacillus cereus]